MLPEPGSRVRPLSVVGELVADGTTVAVGGTWTSARPMAAVRELIRAGRRDLTVVSLTASLELDLLVGAGAARRAVFCFASLGPFGLAPRVRAAAEAGRLELDEHTGHGLTVALEASSRGLDFLPFHGPVGTALAGRYPTVASPVSGEPVEVSAALPVDVALLHAEAATPDGHVLLPRSVGIDVLTARAADRVVVTAERVVERLPEPAGARYLSPSEVHAVVEAPWGAHPLACAPQYGLDWRTLLDYSRRASTAEGFAEWLADDLRATESQRRDRIDDDRRRRLRASGAGGPRRPPSQPPAVLGDRSESGPPEDSLPKDGPPSPVERIVACLAGMLADGDTAVLGSFTPIGYAAVLLAQRTHAPAVDFNAYGFGGTDIGWLGHLGVEGRAVTSGYGPVPFEELVGSLRFRGRLAFEPVRPVQVDGGGALNLRELVRPDGGRIRLPGTAGAAEVLEMHRRPLAYLTDHSRRTCVPVVDDASLRAHLPHEARAAFRLVTDLAVLEFTAAGWQVVSRHPGVSAEQLVGATGFAVLGAESAPTTPEPDRNVVELLRTEVDPLALTELERLGGRQRIEQLSRRLETEERLLLGE